MSSIEFAPSRRVVWTDRNNLGLTEEWVAELVAKGYELVDRRTTEQGKTGGVRPA